jgi:hypothetical protein
VGVSVCALCLREPAVAELPPPRTEGICGRCAARIGQNLERLAGLFERSPPLPSKVDVLDPGGTEEPTGRRAIDGVFEEFQRNIGRAIAPEDVQTHHDLAIAYQEMGLFEDAREELAFVLEHARGELLQRAVKALFGKDFGFRGDLARLRDLLFPA